MVNVEGKQMSPMYALLDAMAKAHQAMCSVRIEIRGRTSTREFPTLSEAQAFWDTVHKHGFNVDARPVAQSWQKWRKPCV